MHALVLLGGQGTRLRPLTYATPKPLLPVVERPMVAHIVEWLARHGVTRTVFALGYQSDAFAEAFPRDAWAGVEIHLAIETEPLDTAGAIRFAALDAGFENEELIVVNGDILTDLDLSELVQFHHRHGGSATVALTPVDDPSAYGVVPTDASGCVLEFIEKPPAGTAPTNMINAGTYVLDPAVIAAIPADRRVSIEREIFPSLVGEGSLFAMASDAYWIDTGTLERFLQAQFDLLSGRRPLVVLPDSAELGPGVRSAPGARLDGTAAGSVFLGSCAFVAPGAELVDVVVGARVEVGAGARITGSVLLADAVVKPDAVVEASIIGWRATVGLGSVVRRSIVGADEDVAEAAALDDVRQPQ